MQQMFAQVAQIALQLAQQYDPPMAEQLAMILMQRQGVTPQAMPSSAPGGNVAAGEYNSTAINTAGENDKEVKQVRDARKRAANSGNVAQ